MKPLSQVRLTYKAMSDMSEVTEAFETLAMQLFQTVELVSIDHTLWYGSNSFIQDHPKDPRVLVMQLEFMSKQKTPDLRTFHEALINHNNLMEPSILNFKR
jgi:hypothetical protein